MRLPSKGMSIACHAGSVSMVAKQASAVARSGHLIHEKTTTSSSAFFTAMGKLVWVPSGTSSPQVSTCCRAPYLRNRGQDAFAEAM